VLVAAWLMDRAARRRRARVLSSRDVWTQIREGKRDARLVDSPAYLAAREDTSWTSWGRRNQPRR
jgi:hypothetical protein